MAHSSTGSTVLLKVRSSAIRPGDVILGPAPIDAPAYRPLEFRSALTEENLSLVPLARPRLQHRASSLDRDDYIPARQGNYELSRLYRDEDDWSPNSDYGSGREGQQRIRRRRPTRRRRPLNAYLGDQAYDSEGSVRLTRRRPSSVDRPLPTRRRTHERRAGRERGKGNNTSSSSSSSDLGSTTDDEKQMRKAKWKKWGAIGLAGVATIHAVHGAKQTYENAHKRHVELATGEISESEAKTMKRKANMRNVFDVGVAAIWVKSAFDEIKESREVEKERREICQKAEERHQKRLERLRSRRL